MNKLGISESFLIVVIITALAVIEIHPVSSCAPGNIQIIKVDGDNHLLGGATFKVTPNPYGGTYLLVTDNGPRDNDNRPGVVYLTKVPVASYKITENKAPTGYKLDNTTQTAAVKSNENTTLKFTDRRGTVQISISPVYENGPNGAVLTYTVTITNTDNVTNTYSLTATDNSGWPENIPPTITVPPLSSGTTTLSVKIPDNAIGGTIDNITVTATGTGASGSGSCTAQVTTNNGTVLISFSPTSQSGPDGAVLTYTVIVTNTGNVTETYNLTPSDNSGWPENISPTSITVPPFSSDNTIILSVTIPENAPGGTIDNITVTATDNGISGSGSCTAQVAIVLPGVDVQITPPWQENLFGGNLTYTVTVTNTGNVVDNYPLTTTDDAGWSLSFSDNLVNNVVENLAPGENRVLTFTININENWVGYMDDVITVTPTSMENSNVSDNASCVAHGIPCTRTASIRLAITGPVPYVWGTSKAKVTVDLEVYTGTNIRLRFFDYDDTFESEVVMWSRTIPGMESASFTNMIFLHDNHLPYPVGIIKRAKMVLTDDSGNVILDNMAWYTPVKDDWGNRLNWIILTWSRHTVAEEDQLGSEISAIILNWSNTPIIRDQWDFFKVFP